MEGLQTKPVKKKSSRSSGRGSRPGELRKIRLEFVKTVKIPVIRGLLGDLLQQKVFSTEDKKSVMENQTIKACLIDMVMGKGERASQIMIDSMKKREHLCSTLGLISSPTAVVGLGDDKTVVKPKKQTRAVNNKTGSAGQELSDQQLRNVAQTLGQTWEQAAIHLGLKKKDLDDIKKEEKAEFMQRRNMLRLWKHRNLGKATAQDLLRGLKDMEDLPVETRQLLKVTSLTEDTASMSLMDGYEEREREQSQGRKSSPSDQNRGQALTSKQLLQVAETLGQEWVRVGIYLDLRTTDLDDIKAGESDATMQKLKMLERWKRGIPGEATAQDLQRGLEDVKDLPCETRQLLRGMMNGNLTPPDHQANAL